MNLSTIVQPQTSAWIVESLGHLLWQGTLIAGLTATVAHGLRGHTAQRRYLLFCGALLLTAACLPLNLWLLASKGTIEIAATVGHLLPLQESLVQSESDFDPSVQRPMPTNPGLADDTGTQVLATQPVELVRQPNTPQHSWTMACGWILATYLLGVLILLLRLFAGLFSSQQLRATATPVDDAHVRDILARFGERFRLGVLPVVAYSEHVTTPLVVSVLKPAILLPAAILSQLTPEQVESLLVHELSHIRRYDHFVNLLQRLVETLLFFHPLVWWLSRNISIEREHCCDDLAIAWGNKPCDYAESLVRVSELQLQAAGLGVNSSAMLAATGSSPSQLRSRVLRVLGIPTAGPTVGLTRYGAALLLAFAISFGAIIAGTAANNSQSADRDGKVVDLNEEVEIVVAASDTKNAPDQVGKEQESSDGLMQGIVQALERMQLEIARQAELTPEEETAYMRLFNEDDLADGENDFTKAGRLEKKSGTPTEIERRAMDKVYQVYIRAMIDQIEIAANGSMSDEELDSAKHLASEGRLFPLDLHSDTLAELLKKGELSDSERSAIQTLHDILKVTEEADYAALKSADKNTDDEASDLVKRWLTLIQQGAQDEAAQLMARGRNENADDVQSMNLLLELASQGKVGTKEKYELANVALVVSNPVERGEHAGKSFLFHLVRGTSEWRIHEVSLVGPKELVAQRGAFRDKPVNHPVDSRGFGPIFERTLQRTETHTSALNLDANRLTHLPNDFDTDRAFTQDPLKWLVTRGIDVAIDQQKPLRGLGGLFQQAVKVDNRSWDEADVLSVRNQLLPPTPGKQASHLQNVKMTLDDSSPVTYVFETLAHPTGTSQQGILQILAVDQTEQAVKLRYKLTGAEEVGP